MILYELLQNPLRQTKRGQREVLFLVEFIYLKAVAAQLVVLAAGVFARVQQQIQIEVFFHILPVAELQFEPALHLRKRLKGLVAQEVEKAVARRLPRGQSAVHFPQEELVLTRHFVQLG